jgi:hypothetical protein
MAASWGQKELRRTLQQDVRFPGAEFEPGASVMRGRRVSVLMHTDELVDLAFFNSVMSQYIAGSALRI